MDTLLQLIRLQQRRTFLQNSTRGIGSLALMSLLNPSLLRAGDAQPNAQQATGPAAVGRRGPAAASSGAGKAHYLADDGGRASHLETFDYKPKLVEMAGKPMPESFTKGQPIAQLQGQKLTCFPPQMGFSKFGANGQELCSSCFRKLGAVSDDICIIRSMLTEAINHDPGAHVHEHRHDDLRPAEHGVVGYVRAGERRGESAGLCRADQHGPRRAESTDLGAAMGERVFAEPISGRAVSRTG